jgi:DNA gyrase subunit A
MKLDEGDHLVGVATLREGDDILLASRLGRCIRFQATEENVRVFAGRDSSGVRGIKLAEGKKPDEVISLSVLQHVDASIGERAEYLKRANARRRNGDEEPEPVVEPVAEIEDDAEATELSEARFEEMAEREEILLTVTDTGFGKRSSAYEYRVSGRGGQGIANITLTARTGSAVAGTFPVRAGDDVMLVTDAGRLIRVPADQVRITGRAAMGVTLFRLDAGERVTSVCPVLEDENNEDGAPAPDIGGSGEPDSQEGDGK